MDLAGLLFVLCVVWMLSRPTGVLVSPEPVNNESAGYEIQLIEFSYGFESPEDSTLTCFDGYRLICKSRAGFGFC